MDQTYTPEELGISAGRPSFGYDVTAQLNSLSLYDTCEGLDSQLDLSREIILSNNYYYQGVGLPEIPEGALTSIAGFATFSGVINVPAFSYLVSLTHYFNPTAVHDERGGGSAATNVSEGFKIRIYDKGAKTELFYNKYAKDATASAPMGFSGPHPATASTEALNVFAAQGPRLLTSPLIVLPPGTLQVEITNLSPHDSLIQVLFNFAIPFGNKAVNVVSVDMTSSSG